MKVTASSRLQANLSICYVTDSDTSTYWMSCFEDDQWILIDFEKPEKIFSVQVLWAESVAKEYQVLISTDKRNWKLVFDKTGKMPNKRNQEIKIVPEVKARYVKINCIKRATQRAKSEREINPLVKK